MFAGRVGRDRVHYLYRGTFVGGPDGYSIDVCADSPTATHIRVENVTSTTCPSG